MPAWAGFVALALARAGQAVTVYEQANRLGELGAGITLSPNAVCVIDWLGLGEQLRAAGFAPDRQWTQHGQTGAVLRESFRSTDFADRHGGAGFYHVHRADLHAMLVDTLAEGAPGALRLGKALTVVTAAGAMTFADGTNASADVVVGADGLKSAVRAARFATAPPRFTGQIAWRGLVPVAALPAEVQALPPGNHIGPQRLILRYPVRGGALINYAAFVELEGWGGRELVDRLDDCRTARAFRWLGPGSTGNHGRDALGRAVQMGAPRARTAGNMDQRRHYAARRFGARDAALHGPGCRDGDRG